MIHCSQQLEVNISLLVRLWDFMNEAGIMNEKLVKERKQTKSRIQVHLVPPFVPEMSKESAKEVWAKNSLTLSLAGNTLSVEITIFNHVNC